MQQIAMSQATAALRRIPMYLADSVSGDPETGVTFSGAEIKVSKNGAAEASFGGSVTEVAGGLYYYEATQAELNTAGFFTVRVNKSGVRPFVAAVQVGTDLEALLTALSAAIAAMQSDVDGNTTLLAAISAALEVVDNLVDELETRLTATRAGKLDYLDLAISAVPTAAENADALLGRTVTGGASGGRTVAMAMGTLVGKFTIEDGVLTLYGADDATVLLTGPVTTSGGRVTSFDPA